MGYPPVKIAPRLAGVLLCLLIAACSTGSPPSTEMPSFLPENPLPACPDSPNCVRETRLFDLPADTLFARAQAALEALDPSSLSATPETRRLDAVLAVFLFKDDVAAVVEPHEDAAVLHIRSASRVGYSDFGVNKRRVEKFFAALEKLL